MGSVLCCPGYTWDGCSSGKSLASGCGGGGLRVDVKRWLWSRRGLSFEAGDAVPYVSVRGGVGTQRWRGSREGLNYSLWWPG